jgi:hypothetical protein
MLEALRSGIKAWNGAGGLVVVNDGTPGSSTYTPVTISCGGCPGGTCVAEGGNGGVPNVQDSNLPIGPHGEDQAAGRIWPSSATTTLKLNTANMWADLNLRCGAGGITNGEIVARATMVGMHEAGHVLSFGHFGFGSLGTNIMFPFSPTSCQIGVTIQQQFKDALAGFNPNSTGKHIFDVNLEDLLPN